MYLGNLLSWFRSFRQHGNKVHRTPRLEALETRLTPAAVNDVFVSSLYHGLLGRAAETGGLTFWTVRLNAGTSRADVVRGIEASNEFLSRELQLFYKTLLGRDIDRAGFNFFGQALRAGTTVEQVKADILGSDEFFARSGGSRNGFFNAVFREELGRGLDPLGQTFFAATPNTVAGRTNAALEILTSPEANRVKVAGDFQQVLGRDPEAVGLSYWVGQIEDGATDADIVAGIAGSSEYFTRLLTFPGLTATNDPNGMADQFIASRRLFRGVLPGVEQLAGNIATDQTLIVPPAGATAGARTTGTVGGVISALQGMVLPGTFAPQAVFQTSFASPMFTGAPLVGQATFTPPTFSSARLVGQGSFTSPTYYFGVPPAPVAVDPNYVNSRPVSPFA